MKPNLIVFASGSPEGGGSGFEKLCLSSLSGELSANIVGVVSNHENGGVRKRADKFGVPFIYFAKDYTLENYRQIVSSVSANFTALSGWIKNVKGLDPRTTFNIHPGPLPAFGGKRMYGHHVHEAVIKAYQRGEIKNSEITMHFVTDEYDKGPIFFRRFVPIWEDDTPEILGTRVNKEEHVWQPRITNMVLQGKIQWDGKDQNSLIGAITL